MAVLAEKAHKTIRTTDVDTNFFIVNFLLSWHLIIFAEFAPNA